MAFGALVRYNKFPGISQEDNQYEWADSSAGAYMFGLVGASYTPDAAHITAADLGANLITTGDGSPINVTGRAVVYTSDGKCWFNSAAANFGSAVTITAKYIVCMMPVATGVHAGTSKLCWYMDMNVGAGLTVSSTSSTFVINPPANGWFSIP